MRPSRPHYRSCLSVSLSICPVWASNSKTRRHRKAKVGVNVPEGWNNWCANFQFKESKVVAKVRVAQCSGQVSGRLHIRSARGRHLCLFVLATHQGLVAFFWICHFSEEKWLLERFILFRPFVSVFTKLCCR